MSNKRKFRVDYQWTIEIPMKLITKKMESGIKRHSGESLDKECASVVWDIETYFKGMSRSEVRRFKVTTDLVNLALSRMVPLGCHVELKRLRVVRE